jgi:acyl-coenzyme A thioesterase PaaI-like protein
MRNNMVMSNIVSACPLAVLIGIYFITLCNSNDKWQNLSQQTSFQKGEPGNQRPSINSEKQSGKKMNSKAFQEYYPDHLSHCYGCGHLNEQGLHIKSYWDGEESVCTFIPGPHHMAVPGIVYGGLIASLIDCHGTGTAAAAAYRAEGRKMDTEPPLRFLTASLHVDYLRPTPMGIPLELRGKVLEIKGRKIIVDIRLLADQKLCAKGKVVAARVPEEMLNKSD